MRQIRILMFGVTVLLAACTNHPKPAPVTNSAPDGGTPEVRHDVAVEPYILDFGGMDIGGQARRSFTVTNRGNVEETVRLSKVPSMAAFHLVFSESADPVTLAPGASVQIPVDFEPLVIDPRGVMDTIKVTVEGTSEPTVVTLMGVAVDYYVTWAPEHCLVFGLVPVGTSVTKSVAIGHLASESRAVTQLSIVNGSNAFMVNGAYPQFIPAKGTQTVEVTYRPTTPLTERPRLHIETDGPNSWTVDVCLFGAGGGPDASVTPTTLDFGETALGGLHQRTVHLENRGIVPSGTPSDYGNLKVSEARIILPPGSTTQLDEFSIDWGKLPIEMKTSATLTEVVEYRPVDVGTDSAILELTTNDPDSPTIQIALTGNGRPPAPFLLSITPAPLSLDFGALTPTHEAVLPVTIENIGTGPCLLDSLQLGAGTASVFTLLDAPAGTLALNPGEVRTLPVTFAPAGKVATFLGSLEFDVNDPFTPHQTIPLKARSVQSCLLLAPDAFDFGATSLGCASETRTLTFYNTCEMTEVTVAGLTFAGSSFQLVSPPTLPRRIPSQLTQLNVRYVPQRAGHELGGLFIQTDERPEPYLVPLSGDGVNGAARHEDTWRLPPKVDVLFVVDSSAALSLHRAALASFIEDALQSNVDFHIAVTTTDISEKGERGRFLPLNRTRPTVLDRNTPNLESVFIQNIDVGWVGSLYPSPLEAARQALQPANLATSNAGFLRDDASLSIIVISKYLDCSPRDSQYYAAALMGVKGFRRADMLSFSAIVYTNPASSNYGRRAIELAEETGGFTGPVDTNDWSLMLQSLSKYTFGPRRRFTLSAMPASPQQLTVALDGTPVGPANGNSVVWSYDPSKNVIEFDPASPPPPGVTVSAEYPVTCVAP